jgi:hypothetical protein
MAAPTAPVDTSSISMDEAGDKMATNGETSSPKGAKKRKGPFHKVLDWKAVDLDRKFIEVRAGQAKTASRRVIPISDNLAAWLTPLERKGKIVRTKELQTHVPALARVLKMEWPRNVLRDSFISYRIAIVQSADQVALEAGNSPSIIFKHYRELTTPEVAQKWFSILPKDGQWENTLRYVRKKRRMILNGVECK